MTNEGMVIAVEGRNNASLVVRELQRGADVAKLPHASKAALSPGGAVAALALSKPAGDIAFYGTRDGVLAGTVHVNLPQTSKLSRGKLFTQSTHVADLLWSADGKRVVAVLSSGGPTYVLDATSRTLLQTIAKKGKLVALDASGARGLFVEYKYELLSSDAKAVSVIDLAQARTVRRIEFKALQAPAGDPDAMTTAELSHATFGLSADGKKVFAYEYGELTAIDVASGTREKLLERPPSRGLGLFSSLGGFGFSSQGNALRVSPDGSHIVLRRGDGNALVSLADQTERALEEGSPEAFSPDGRVLVSTTAHMAFVDGASVEVPQGHEGPVKALAILAGGKVLASGGDSLRLWDARSCQPLTSTHSQGQVHWLGASANGSQLVVRGASLRIVQSGGKIRTIPLKSQVTAMTVSRDGASIAIGDSHVEGGRRVRVVPTSGPEATASVDATVESLAFTADGKSIAVLTGRTWTDEAPARPQLVIRNATTLAIEAKLPEDLADDTTAAVFTASADELLLGHKYRGIQLYDRKRSLVVRRFTWEGCCQAMTVSPDGALLAAAANNEVVVWETGTRKLRGVARGHTDEVRALAFTPDGTRVASGSDDTTVLVWEVAQLRAPAPPADLRELAGVASVRALARSDRVGLYVDALGKLARLEPAAKGKLPDLGKLRQIASAGLSHCALLESGKVACWGYTRGGVLGTPEERRNKMLVDRERPLEVPGVADAASISGAGQAMCALTSQGAVWCWGTFAPGYGRSDDAPLKAQDPAPRAVPGIGPASCVSVGEGHACALARSGQVHCWGLGRSGQLGDGAGKSSLAPVTVQGIDDAQSVACGDAHCCAVRRDGSVWCWGSNEREELGTGSGMDSVLPLRVPGVERAAEVGTTDRLTCARASDGAVTCWGRSYSAKMSFVEPTVVPALAGASAIDVKSSAVCVELGGKVKCLE